MCGEVKKAALMVFVRMPEIYVTILFHFFFIGGVSRGLLYPFSYRFAEP